MARKSDANVNEAIDSSIRSRILNTKDLSMSPKSAMYNQMDEENDDEIEDNPAQFIELNNRIKNSFISYCLSFLREDEETRQCIQIVWNKYLQCVGDVAMLSAFFDTLPFPIKTSVLPKYQTEVLDWYQNLFHIRCDTLLYSTYHSESFLQTIRYVHKLSNQETNVSTKKAIIYVSIDFDTNLKKELLSSLSNVQFEHCKTDLICEDMIDINQLDQFIQRDLNHSQAYPMMVIAQAGTTVLGHCDEITKIKQLCDRYKLWLHVTGDLLGSLALLPTVKDYVTVSCDSLTVDMVKLLGIQNLPYVTSFIRPIVPMAAIKSIELSSTSDEGINNDSSSTASTNASLSSSTSANNTNSMTSNPFYEMLLHSPSINLLSVWSISQRCSPNNVVYHMKRSLDLVTLFMKSLKPIKTLSILNDSDQKETMTYRRICSGDGPETSLPKTVAIFRFETNDVPEIDSLNDLTGYLDLLNLWLFDKLYQQYPKMNLELLKSTHFQIFKSNDNRAAAHAIRFAPLEHLLDVIDESDIQSFLDDVQRYSDILLATMTARARLSSSVAKYENLISIPMPNWAGIGAIRYVPNQTQPNETTDKRESSSYDINTIQAELARKLQANDSAFSLGGSTTDHESMFYLRLGMIRKRDDLDVLLQKIADAGKETETSLKYVEDMAQKIKIGIGKVQQDLKNENQQLLAQEGLLRQLPVISNIMSWWSPSPTASPLATKGRSFDLNSGCVESTEDTYVYRMQIKKQSPHAPTHNADEDDDNDNDNETVGTSTDTDGTTTTNSTDTVPEQKNNQ